MKEIKRIVFKVIPSVASLDDKDVKCNYFEIMADVDGDSPNCVRLAGYDDEGIDVRTFLIVEKAVQNLLKTIKDSEENLNWST